MNAVLREIEGCGAVVYLKDGQPYIKEGVDKLPASLIQQAKMIREEIISVLEMNEKAKEFGFLRLIDGVYERQYSHTGHVFITYEQEQWRAWRETWRSDQKRSNTLKELYSGVSFDDALRVAKQFTEYMKRRGE